MRPEADLSPEFQAEFVQLVQRLNNQPFQG